MTIDARFEHEAAADSLFEEGRRRFKSDDLTGAKFFLAFAGRVYDKLEGRFHRKIVRDWYVSTLNRLGETPSDEPSVWYNK